MKASSENKSKSLAYKLFKEMQEDNLEYTYRGSFTSQITDTILSLAENNLNNVETPVKTRKRVYFIMVEGLQNVTRHQIKTVNENFTDYPGLFVVQRKGHGYYITTGNLISNNEKEHLTTLLDKINSLDTVELKKFSMEILDTGEISSKGGAGLGLVEMARRSKSKLNYDFKELDKNHSFFYMQTKIPHTDNSSKNQKYTQEEEENSLQNIKELHKLLEKQNIILNFSGNFTQETLINLLSIIEKQLHGTIILKMKVFNLMVEMLQNVVKHADNYTHDDVVGKHAIFYISESDENITFTTGNYIKNERIEKFNDKLEKINSLDRDKLSDYYNKSLFNFEDNTDVHTGLGLIDIKMKSKNPFNFAFYKINEKYSFFSLQTIITKMKNEINTYKSKANSDTPEVNLNSEKGKLSFIGRSIPENAVTFYKPIHEWIDKYSKTPHEITEITFKLDYFNTASDKQIAKLMLAFEKLSENNKVIIKWKYLKGDFEMMNDGIKYQELTNLNIELVEI